MQRKTIEYHVVIDSNGDATILFMPFFSSLIYFQCIAINRIFPALIGAFALLLVL
ncbi:hypothetical protein BH10CYA1_BH10CYA1_00020 [soil metagenome]